MHISVGRLPEAFKVLCFVFWVLIFKCFAVSVLSREFTLRYVSLRCVVLCLFGLLCGAVCGAYT